MTDPVRPNVVLLVMDTARARTVWDRPDVMPNLHDIADDGVRFRNAFTTAPWTVPSHASMFTGQYTSDHGSHAGARRFDPDVPSLAERLRSAGYQTVGLSNNTWIGPEFGFDRGFEAFLTGWTVFEGGRDVVEIAKREDGSLAQALALLRELSPREAPKTLANALYGKLLRRRYDDGAWLTNRRIDRWLSRRRDRGRPFFLFVNYLEPHLEYGAPAPFRYRFVPEDVDRSFVDGVSQDAWEYVAGNVDMSDREFEALEALYEGELHYLDHRIGELFERLSASGLLDETVLIVTGDHGENIGDHGLMDHQYCLYDTLLHVPLVIRYPDGRSNGAESEELVELRDLYPTILDLAGAPSPGDPSIATNSLASDAPGRDFVVGEYLVPQPSMDALEERVGSISPETASFDRALRSIRTADWKYVEGSDGAVELYAVDADPAESVDRSEDRPGVRGRLDRRLRVAMGELERPDRPEAMEEVAAGARRRLEDLGYI